MLLQGAEAEHWRVAMRSPLRVPWVRPQCREEIGGEGLVGFSFFFLFLGGGGNKKKRGKDGWKQSLWET